MAVIDAQAVSELATGRKNGSWRDTETRFEGFSVHFDGVDALGKLQPQEIAA